MLVMVQSRSALVVVAVLGTIQGGLDMGVVNSLGGDVVSSPVASGAMAERGRGGVGCGDGGWSQRRAAEQERRRTNESSGGAT